MANMSALGCPFLIMCSTCHVDRDQRSPRASVFLPMSMPIAAMLLCGLGIFMAVLLSLRSSC